MKLIIKKCHFGVTQVNFFGRAITPDVVAPQDHKATSFLAKKTLLGTKELITEVHWPCKLITTEYEYHVCANH